mgnify:CR=1 FL=1
MTKLMHKTIFEDNSRISVKLPLIDELKNYNIQGDFPLIVDPLKIKESVFIGMFVLRPARIPWSSQVNSKSFYEVKNWTYNVKGVDGGWMIANGNVVDAYRLALKYGVSDCVIVGSTTASGEGTPKDDKPG